MIMQTSNLSQQTIAVEPSLDAHDLRRPERLIRLPEVMARVGFKKSMIYQLMSEGRFPQSLRISVKCTVWIESEIEAWVHRVKIKANAQL